MPNEPSRLCVPISLVKHQAQCIPNKIPQSQYCFNYNSLKRKHRAGPFLWRPKMEEGQEGRVKVGAPVEPSA